jgi:hypothetical protein
MEFITERSRNQIVLLPDSIEEYTGDDNAVRVSERISMPLISAARNFPVRRPGLPDDPGTLRKTC